ncbi:MAG: protein phosphatase 2C domain-containing protein [Gammaproteobacteria bacterium]|nr:protein phosphatase 2C domain-containing protein [Gammaproteobacteria bacterium]
MHSVAYRSEKGSRSKENEDAYLALPSIGFFAVADGVGSGLKSGDAARKTVELLFNELNEYVPSKDSILHAINSANTEIFNHIESVQSKNTACTLSAIWLNGDQAIIFHVGDSRIYKLSGQTLSQITQDHVKAISHDGLKNKNVLTRAIGSQLQVEVDTQQFCYDRKDSFTLMTDGVSDKVSQKIIESIIANHTLGSTQKVEQLIDSAIQAHSTDDKTVILVSPTEPSK